MASSRLAHTSHNGCVNAMASLIIGGNYQAVVRAGTTVNTIILGGWKGSPDATRTRGGWRELRQVLEWDFRITSARGFEKNGVKLRFVYRALKPYWVLFIYCLVTSCSQGMTVSGQIVGELESGWW